MKIKMLFTFLLVVIILVACSPAVTPIPINMRGLTPTFASVLPTAPPTPTLASGSARAQSVMEAYKDTEVGRRWSFGLHKGEKAYLDQDGNILEIQDAQGRVVLENLGGEQVKVRYYAWEGGYNTIVGSGILLLKAGYSYTQNMFSNDWNNEVAEVRQISNNQLLGYVLLIETYNSNYQRTGLETPVAFIDSNGDGLVSIQELDTALAGLRAEAISIVENQPSLVERFIVDINTAYGAINRGAIADAYLKTKQLQLDITSAVQAVKDQAVKDQWTGYLGIAITVFILFLVAFGLVRRIRPRMQMRDVSTTPDISKKAVKKPKQIESQEGELETTGKTVTQKVTRVKKENKSESQSVQRFVGIKICPSCKLKVVPKSDGTCPSCQSKIM